MLGIKQNNLYLHDTESQIIIIIIIILIKLPPQI